MSKLSLALQQEDIDPVKAIDALVTIKEKLTKLKERPVEQFSSISTIKRKSSINEDNDLVYQDVVLNEMEKEIQKLSNKQGKEFTAVEDIICARLDEDGSFLKPIARILNCESWGESTEEDNDSNCDFADTDIKKLLHNFNKPLESAGVNISETEFLEEWNDLVRYTKTYLIPAKSSYLKTWRRIFNSSRAKTDFKNVLLLVEICFVTPPIECAIRTSLFSNEKGEIQNKMQLE